MSLRKSWSESVEISRARPAPARPSPAGHDDDVDLELLERSIEIFDLACIEVELVERKRDLFLGHRPEPVRFEQVAGFLALENFRKAPTSVHPCAHVLPLRRACDN